MSTFLQDLRFSLRSLRRAPAFPLAAIVTLALGIGATTAIFTTLNAVLLKPLPYPNSGDLYSIRTTLTDGRVTTGLIAATEIFPLNNPSLGIERAAALQGFDLTLLHPRRHAETRPGLRRQQGVFRAVRPADDARRLHRRPVRAVRAAAATPARRAAGAAAAASAAGDRDLPSRVAEPVQQRPDSRRQVHPLRGDARHDCRRRASGVRHAARAPISGSPTGSRPTT